MFVLGPVTEYFVAHSWTSTRPTSFPNEWIKHLRNGEFLQENGPLWFCLALLIFSALYALWRALFHDDAPKTQPPTALTLTVSILVLAAASFTLYLIHAPTLLNMHLPDFSQYILLFIAGIFAARGKWFEAMPYAPGIRWLLAAVTVGLVAWLLIVEQACAFCPGVRVSVFLWTLALKIWEAFTCVAMSVGLLCLYRKHFPSQGRVAKFLSDNAFAVYVFHPPIVILGARALHGVAWHPFLKFATLTAFGIVASYTLSGALFRRIPVLKSIL